MVKIIQAGTYPDTFDVENLDENQSRQFIGRLGGIRRKNLNDQDVSVLGGYPCCLNPNIESVVDVEILGHGTTARIHEVAISWL